MDIWVVAAAAGAGYVAQRLKNVTKCKDLWTELSLENHNFVRPGSTGSIEKVPEKRASRKGLWEQRRGEIEQSFQDASSAEVATDSGTSCENFAVLDNFADCSTESTSNPITTFLNDKDIQRDYGGRVPPNIDEVDTCDIFPKPSSRNTRPFYGFRRNRSSLRSRRIYSQFIKPQTSLESCLMAQLYKEHAEIEEYTYSVHPSQKQIVRPFLVSDGNRIISGGLHEYFGLTGMDNYVLQKDTNLQENSNVYGVPGLPNVTPMDLPRKTRANTGKPQIVRSDCCDIVKGNHSNSQGSTGGPFLFYVGLTMGIVASLLLNKQETAKLNNLLKQTENLVQDLHEELEMKDSLTVRELAVEEFGSQDPNDATNCGGAAHVLSLVQNSDDSSRYYNGECGSRMAEKESMSKIEAELEAELERLESNINSSRVKGKQSTLAELDPNFASDVIVGDFRADLFGTKTDSQPYADRDGSGSSTPNSLRYPVSPRELSLRLHEVIQSRLHDRIEELEMALQNSQMKLRSVESEHLLQRQFSNHKQKISVLNSPIARDEQQFADQPVVINLSGEALTAYHEAYEELNRVSDSDDDQELSFGLGTSNHQEIFDNCKQVLDQVHSGGVCGFGEQCSIADENQETVISCSDRRDGYALSYDVLCSSSDGSEDGDDEMERLLIRQIVEKARQGSPAVLNAQRALLLTDDK